MLSLWISVQIICRPKDAPVAVGGGSDPYKYVKNDKRAAIKAAHALP